MTETMIAGHLEPVWGDRADDLVYAELTHVDDGAWEMLPARRIDEQTYELCAIPFFARDINLGDRVEAERRRVEEVGDEVAVVARAVEESGHWTFRVAFNTPEAEAARAKVVERLQEFGCLVEWNDPTMCAVSVEGGRRYAHQVGEWLLDLERKGKLEYETGRMRAPGEAEA